jgi:hypothetical protein
LFSDLPVLVAFSPFAGRSPLPEEVAAVPCPESSPVTTVLGPFASGSLAPLLVDARGLPASGFLVLPVTTVFASPESAGLGVVVFRVSTIPQNKSLPP